MSDERIPIPNLSIGEVCYICDGDFTDLTRLSDGHPVCERCLDKLAGGTSCENEDSKSADVASDDGTSIRLDYEILRANRKETVGRVRDVDMHNKEVPGCIADALTIIKKFDACLPRPFRKSLILTLMDLFEKEEEEDQ